MKHLMAVIVLLAAPSAFAQYVVRNGGYVVSCLNQPTVALEMAEAKEEGLSVQYSPARSYQAKVSDLIARIRPVNSQKALKYTQWLKQWPQQIRWKSSFALEGPNDQGDLELGRGCRMKIAIVQTNETRFGVQQYEIDSLVWGSLDENQKAALVMHEFIYRDILEENPESNSFEVRFVNKALHDLDSQLRDRRKFTELMSRF
ncbi:hypothetical protein [Bdellovibrio bacteriovorus]|uniref:Uncharacterized protein n=1 Tax=Bdellovibrio bacteriovorus str. Tiberius TaxID=1069642 RepID=K7ZEW9_BDEBC|nr:hypothetical protein [Bdellovibrio bacteriovorus]AFY00907.1 hypothetical protein Bdt_1208 [Bdellovibrio bacteriovorus str. Tiberius]